MENKEPKPPRGYERLSPYININGEADMRPDLEGWYIDFPVYERLRIAQQKEIEELQAVLETQKAISSGALKGFTAKIQSLEADLASMKLTKRIKDMA